MKTTDEILLPHEIANLMRQGRVAEAARDLHAIRRDQSFAQVMDTLRTWKAQRDGKVGRYDP